MDLDRLVRMAGREREVSVEVGAAVTVAGVTVTHAGDDFVAGSWEPGEGGEYSVLSDRGDQLRERWSETVRYHAYEARFTTPTMKYLSDSSGHWREGHFAEWVDKVPVLQVLTHPFWWFETVPAENY